MSYDGNGNYTVPVGTRAVPGQIIDSDLFNTLLDDIASAFTKVLARDGQGAMTNALKMGAFKITGLLDGVAPQDAVTLQQAQLGTAAVAKQLTGEQLTALILGRISSMAMARDAGATPGSFVSQSVGLSDANMAGQSYSNVNGPTVIGIKMGLRADGYFGIGGWSRDPWSWYTDPQGNMVAAGDVVAYSDPRLKENFDKIHNPRTIVKKLQGMRFAWRHGIAHTQAKGGKPDLGFLSNNVAEVLPEAVSSSVAIDGTRYDLVCYSKIIPVLVEAFKEQDEEIAGLQKEVAKLRALVG